MPQGIHDKSYNGKNIKDVPAGKAVLNGFPDAKKQAENCCYQPDNFNDITNLRVHF
jgi:hypothetical protein